MEYFSSDPRVLQDISLHYQTGLKLDLETLEKFAASKKIFVAADIQSQLCYSILDQRLHAQQTPKSSTTDIMREIHQEHHSLPFSDGTAWQHRFSHLVRKQLSIYSASLFSFLPKIQDKIPTHLTFSSYLLHGKAPSWIESQFYIQLVYKTTLSLILRIQIMSGIYVYLHA